MEDKIFAAILGTAAWIVMVVLVAGSAVVIVTERAVHANSHHCEVISK